MRVDLTQDQRELRTGAREVLASLATPATLRSAYDEGALPDPGRWSRLAEIGFTGLVVPTDHDGLGLGDLELALVLEEAGRTALPEALLEQAVVALTLAESGSPEQQERWLPALASGEVRATVRLPGSALAVDADLAQIALLEVGDELHVVPVTATHVHHQTSVDRARRTFSLDPSVDRAADDGTRLPGTGQRELERLQHRACVGGAALLVGVAQHLLDETVAYVRDREQFGRPVGSFQAVKHRLADVHQQIANARPATWVAAHVLHRRHDDVDLHALAAKAFASQAASAAGDAALQLHGGIGFAWEHDLQMWLKRGKALEVAYGSAPWCRARIADRIFG